MTADMLSPTQIQEQHTPSSEDDIEMTPGPSVIDDDESAQQLAMDEDALYGEDDDEPLAGEEVMLEEDGEGEGEVLMLDGEGGEDGAIQGAMSVSDLGQGDEGGVEDEDEDVVFGEEQPDEDILPTPAEQVAEIEVLETTLPPAGLVVERTVPIPDESNLSSPKPVSQKLSTVSAMQPNVVVEVEEASPQEHRDGSVNHQPHAPATTELTGNAEELLSSGSTTHLEPTPIASTAQALSPSIINEQIQPIDLTSSALDNAQDDESILETTADLAHIDYSASPPALVESPSSHSSSSSTSSPFYPVTISYPPPSSAASSGEITYSLFLSISSENPEPESAVIKSTPLPVLLSSSQAIFYEPLSSLFEALKEEAAFAGAGDGGEEGLHGCLALNDQGGTKEWVLEHTDERLNLCIGEDNIYARTVTLADLAQLHALCDLPAPLTLKLRAGETRFMLQYNMIQRMSAGEEYEEDEDVDIELEEGAEELGQEKEHVEHEEATNDDAAHLSEQDAQDDFDHPNVGVREQDMEDDDTEQLIQEQETRFEDYGEIRADDELLEKSAHADEPKPEEEGIVDTPGGPTDYPNGPDDPTATDDQHAADPPAEINGKEDVSEEEVAALDAPPPAASEEAPRIAENTKIVLTANGDLEVPLDAPHTETSKGDFDEEAALGVYDEEDDDKALVEEPDVGDEDGAEAIKEEETDEERLKREVEREAAEATTKGLKGEETVEVPRDFKVVIDEGEGEKQHGGKESEQKGEVVEGAVTSSKTKKPANDVASSSSTRRSTRLNPSILPPAEPTPTPSSTLPTSTTTTTTTAAYTDSLPVPNPTTQPPQTDDEEEPEDFYADSPLPPQPLDDEVEVVGEDISGEMGGGVDEGKEGKRSREAVEGEEVEGEVKRARSD